MGVEAELLMDEERQAFEQHLEVAAKASDLQAHPVEPGTEPLIPFVASLPGEPGVECGHQSVRASHARLCCPFFQPPREPGFEAELITYLIAVQYSRSAEHTYALHSLMRHS